MNLWIAAGLSLVILGYPVFRVSRIVATKLQIGPCTQGIFRRFFSEDDQSVFTFGYCKVCEKILSAHWETSTDCHPPFYPLSDIVLCFYFALPCRDVSFKQKSQWEICVCWLEFDNTMLLSLPGYGGMFLLGVSVRGSRKERQ